MKKIILAVVILTGSMLQAQAQMNMSSLETTWTSSKTFDANNGIWSEETTSLTLHGRERMVWKNANGSIRKTFLVNEIRGEWSSLETEGSVQYEITEGNTNGTITIQKNAQGTKALIVIASQEPQSYELLFIP